MLFGCRPFSHTERPCAMVSFSLSLRPSLFACQRQQVLCFPPPRPTDPKNPGAEEKNPRSPCLSFLAPQYEGWRCRSVLGVRLGLLESPRPRIPRVRPNYQRDRLSASPCCVSADCRGLSSEDNGGAWASPPALLFRSFRSRFLLILPPPGLPVLFRSRFYLKKNFQVFVRGNNRYGADLDKGSGEKDTTTIIYRRGPSLECQLKGPSEKSISAPAPC